jgi:glutamate-1-semialdehyde 2,1-aminomutase
MEFKNSIKAFEQAKKSIPGGVNSPVRSFNSVGSNPVFIKKAFGSHIEDIDGNDYVDYVGSWGPMILGHAHPDVIKAVQDTAVNGTSYGAPTEVETEMAELIKSMMPSIEIVRMVNSGTEATMSALRLARGYTGRRFIIKFEGCYHGHGDSFLINAGSGALTMGVPNSPGVTEGTASDTLLAKFNDLESVKSLFEKYGDQIAGLIIEPVTGNMGVVVPNKEFIQGVRDVCTQYGALLIFDEVMTGFRLAKGGAQEILGITPDITTMGKIIGGGLPVGAYGGKREIMEHVAPAGPVYQAGTLSGNPLAMSAGLTTLKLLNETPDFYNTLETKAEKLVSGLQKVIDELQFPAVINRVGSMFTLFFTDQDKVESFEDVKRCDTARFAKFFDKSLQAGIYLAPSQFEAGFMSIAHTDADIDKTIEASRKALEELKAEL